MKVGRLMPGHPYGVIAVSEMTRKLKDTLPDVLSTIIRKEDGFQGGKLTRHPVTKAKTMSLLVMYKMDNLWDEACVKRG